MKGPRPGGGAAGAWVNPGARPGSPRPPREVEMTSERMASSLTRPPALRTTWASPSLRPAYLAGSSRASMQVTAKWRAGGMASRPFSPKLPA